MAKAAYPTIGIAALVMFGIVYLIGCLRITNNITNWGLLIVIVLVLLELYGALYFDKFTEKQMQMFFGGVFVVYLASTISVVLCFEKLMEMISVEPSVKIIFKTPIIYTIIIAISYRYYRKAISRLLIW